MKSQRRSLLSPRRASTNVLGAVILAGGRSKRLPNKCFSTLGNRALILHVIDRVSRIINEIVVAVRTAEQARAVGLLHRTVRIVFDESKSQSPLVGFLSGLHAIKSTYVFAAPCDAPFIEPKVIQLLFERALGNDGAIAVADSTRLEPLCGIYHRDKAISAAQKSIESGRMSMLDMLGELKRLVKVPVKEIQETDPQLLTFRNINTAEDCIWAERMIQEQPQTSSAHNRE